MGLFLAIVFSVIAFTSYSTNDKKISPTFIFALIWCIISFFESLHLFALYNSNFSTYIVILLGVLSFSLGSFTFRKITVTATHNDIHNDYCVNIKLFYSLIIFTIVMQMIPTINNISSLAIGQTDFSTIRKTFSNGYSNIYFALIYNYIVQPFASACLPIVAVMSFDEYSNKEKVILLSLTLVVILEKIFIDAGRGIIIYFCVMIYFSFKMQTTSPVKLLDKKSKKIVTVITVIAIAAYIGISYLRSGSLVNFSRQIYTYICGCIPFLNANLKEFSHNPTYMYGFSGMHGLYQFIFTMLENFGLMKYPSFMSHADMLYTNTLISRRISDISTFNAYATAFYHVYIDGGFVAVFIEMFLYGAFSRNAYNSFRLNPENQRAKAVYIFVLHGIAFSFIRYQFTLSQNFIVYFMIYFVISKRSNFNESITDKYGLQEREYRQNC